MRIFLVAIFVMVSFFASAETREERRQRLLREEQPEVDTEAMYLSQRPKYDKKKKHDNSIIDETFLALLQEAQKRVDNQDDIEYGFIRKNAEKILNGLVIRVHGIVNDTEILVISEDGMWNMRYYSGPDREHGGSGSNPKEASFIWVLKIGDPLVKSDMRKIKNMEFNEITNIEGVITGCSNSHHWLFGLRPNNTWKSAVKRSETRTPSKSYIAVPKYCVIDEWEFVK
jgi:hypothetical protein